MALGGLTCLWWYCVGVVPLCVQVRMESSSKWPEDLTVLRDAKTAFLLHIAKQYDTHPLQ